jgi:hypothetical protein
MDETNERGNCVERHYFSSDRYCFESLNCIESEGWKQLDTVQDVWNFGIWVHFERCEVITYAEGDILRVICSDDQHLQSELMAMAYSYGHTLVTLKGKFSSRTREAAVQHSAPPKRHRPRRSLPMTDGPPVISLPQDKIFI